VSGDIVQKLSSVVAIVPDDQHLAIQNSWVLSYRPTQVLTALLAVIDGIGAARDLSWVFDGEPASRTGSDAPCASGRDQ